MLRPRKDPLIDAPLRKALAGRVTNGSGDCPDENIVTMYLENRLEPAGKARYETHVSGCPPCRQVLALALKVAVGDETNPGVEVSAGRIPLSLRLPFARFALAIVVVAIGILVFYEMNRPRRGPETAEYRLSESRQAEPAGPPVRSEDSSTVSQLTQDAARKPATPSADNRNAVPTPPVLTGAGARKSGKESASGKLSETARSVAPTDAAAAAAANGRNGPGALAGISAFNSDNLTVDPAGPGISGVSGMGHEPPRNVLAAFSQRFISDKGYVGLGLEDQPPSARSVAEFDGAAVPRTAGAQRPERVAAKIGEPEGELKWKITARKQIGDRVWFLISGYWIDPECGKHPDAEIVEISEGDAGSQEIRGAFPGITELRSASTPVMLHWKGKNYVIR